MASHLRDVSSQREALHCPLINQSLHNQIAARRGAITRIIDQRSSTSLILYSFYAFIVCINICSLAMLPCLVRITSRMCLDLTVEYTPLICASPDTTNDRRKFRSCAPCLVPSRPHSNARRIACAAFAPAIVRLRAHQRTHARWADYVPCCVPSYAARACLAIAFKPPHAACTRLWSRTVDL